MRTPGKALFVAASLLAFALPGRAATADAEFVEAAASGGLMEVELGNHVAKHASHPEVRAFGERMAADHAKANQELKQVAGRAGMALPAEMKKEHRDTLQGLTKLRGPDLDEAYMRAMVEDHEKDVDAFRSQAEQEDSEVDRWAARTLPTLEAHLTHAEEVAKRVEAAMREGPGSGDPVGGAGRAVDPSATGTGRP